MVRNTETDTESFITPVRVCRAASVQLAAGVSRIYSRYGRKREETVETRLVINISSVRCFLGLPGNIEEKKSVWADFANVRN